MFQVVFVHACPNCLPVVAPREGVGLRAGAIYFRQEGQTEEATYEEVQKLIDERLLAAPQTIQARNLKEHLEELKVLYAEIPRTLNEPGGLFGPLFSMRAKELARMLGDQDKPNPAFPEEDYQMFVRGLLDSKKSLIKGFIGLDGKT